MNENKHIHRFWDGWFMFIIPIITMTLIAMLYKQDFFRIIFIFQLLMVGMYLEGLLIDKAFKRG